MADPSTIANIGVDPTTGSYLSRERRLAIFRNRNITAADAGFGGPQTSAIVRRQDTSIAQLQNEIGTLKKSQTESIEVFRKEIGTIQSNIQVIAANIKDLGSTIKQSNILLSNDAELEKRKELQDQIQESKLAEEGARFGKESQLEQKIQNAILAPIRGITAKAQSIFSILQDTLAKFFLGWLTINILDMFRAESQNNQNLVKQIFDNIVSSVAAVFKTLQVINKTFRGIIGIVTGVTKLLAKFLTTSVGLLFKGLGSLASGIVNAGKALASGAGKIVAKVTGTQVAETAASTAAKTAAKEGAETAGKTAGKSLFKKFPGVSLLAGTAFGIERLYSGDPFGAGLEFASGIAGTFAGPGTAISLGIDAFSLKRRLDQTAEQGEKVKEAKTKAFSPPKTPPASTTPPPKSTPPVSPTTSMMPTPMELSIDTSKMANAGEMDFSKPAQFGEVTAPVEEGTANKPTQQASITPAKTQSIPTAAAKVGPEPEAKPNVVMMSSVPGAPGRPDTVLLSQPTPASDVPNINSSNPDNFYALYSQINYNVLI
jgi:hypothetical protein